MRRAKIVCTLGPATDEDQTLTALVEAGMDVARLNMSHGTHADHEKRYHMVRRATDSTGHAVGILADLQGPKIRTGRFAKGPVQLQRGQHFTLTTRDVLGDETCVGTTHARLPEDVKTGDMLLLDDGKLQLTVAKVGTTDVLCEVVIGGQLSDNKGINLPGAAVSVPALSEKDEADLRWALKFNVDMIAMSFVRTADDIKGVHAIMDEVGVRLPVIAKIEKPQAVENLEAIVQAFDGVMVARGDLGVELPLEEVPLVQKDAVTLARQEAKPVIVATQVLESMVTAPRPTRAEASDCANAVIDGADAIMLSGETSVGEWPVLAVRTMANIITTTELHGHDRIETLDMVPTTVSGAVTKAAADIAEVVGAKFLCTFTTTGGSTRRLARVRSKVPTLAFSPDPQVRSWLSVTWGVETYLVPFVRHTDDMVRQVDEALLSTGRCVPGDVVVIVAGSPPGIPGTTNACRVHRIGDAVAGRAPAYREQALEAGE